MEFNDAYFEQLARSAAVNDLVKSRADAIAARARATAPVDSGDYKGGIVVRKKRASRRDVWLVVGTNWKTLLVESKTGNLVRALRSVGRG